MIMPMDLMVEASPRRIFANAHTYHINSISVNSDHETYLSADDLRINLWHMEITDRSFSILCQKVTGSIPIAGVLADVCINTIVSIQAMLGMYDSDYMDSSWLALNRV